MLFTNAEQFQKMAQDYNKLAMDSWSSLTKQTVQSDSFASASGAFMDWSLATHKMMTELSGQWMESLDVPKRSDLARLSAQVQALETRLMDQEEQSAEIKDLLLAVLSKLEAAPGPVAPPVVEAAPVQTETTALPKVKKAKK